MEVIRHAELIVEWFLWTIEHTNRSLDNSNATFRPSRASSGMQSMQPVGVLDRPKEPFYYSANVPKLHIMFTHSFRGVVEGP